MFRNCKGQLIDWVAN